MRPWVAFGEVLNEFCAGADATGAAAAVFDFGHGGLDGLGIFRVHGHGPQAFAGALGGGKQCVLQRVVVGEAAGGLAAQCDANGAGERGEIYDGGGVIARHIAKRIGQHQPALGIGADDLNCFAGDAGEDVAGAEGVAVRHVFDADGDAQHAARHMQECNCLHGAHHSSGAAHVVLHHPHALRILEGDSACVKGNALAHQDQRSGSLHAFRRVLQNDKARRVFAAAAYGQCNAHARIVHICFVEDGAGEPGSGCHGTGARSELYGIENIAGFADIVAGAADGCCNGCAGSHAGLDGCQLGGV